VEKAPGGDTRPDRQQPDIDAVMTRSTLMSREEALEKADIHYLSDLMRLTRGNIKESCRISGLGRTRLYTLLKKYNISRTGWSASKTAGMS
jgi:transcriptional regulator of acetoin/glycerol metabolism